jgi:hypothetical protein
MKKKIQVKLICSLMAVLWIVVGCKKDPVDSFPYMKIYDEKEGNKSFLPLSIVKSPVDNGYVILSSFDGWKIQITKIDNEGGFLWNYELPDAYVNAVPSLLKINNELVIVCMDPVGLYTQLLRIDETNHTVIDFSSIEEVLYPTYAHFDGQSLYIQNCPLQSQMMGVHRVNQALDTVEKSGYLNIFTNVDDKVLDHLTNDGKKIPFFLQTTPEKDFVIMNGFYNYSFSTVFLNNNLEFEGVLNGAGFDGGICALQPLGASAFSIARTSNHNLFYAPKVILDPTQIEMATSIVAQGNSELDDEKTVVVKEITIKGVTYEAFISSTRSNQLLLCIYNENGILVGKKYIGKNIPMVPCDFLQTPEKDILLVLQTKILGSFNRIATVNITKLELEEMLP